MMMKNIKKEKKGISLVVLLIVIGVMLILLSTITISLDNIVTNSKKRQFAKEVYEIQSMVDTYKKQNDEYPYVKLAEGNKTIDLEVDNGNEDQVASEDVIDDKVTLYVINMQKIGANELSRGYNQDNDETDVYAFSSKTGIVYYVKGYSVRRKIYYTLTDELKKLIGLNTAGNSSSMIKGEIIIDPNPYIYTSLILRLDGIINYKNGSHSETINKWQDLSIRGNEYDLVNIGFNGESNWKEDSLHLDGVNDGIFIRDKMKELFKSDCTIELTFDMEKNDNRDIIFGNYSQTHCVNLERYDNNLRIYWNNGNPNYYFSDFFKNENKLNMSLVLNKNAGKLDIYKNGIYFNSYINSEFKNYNYDYLNAYIGRDSRNGLTCLKGSIYEARIYNRALTEEEIKHNYYIDKERFNLE